MSTKLQKHEHYNRYKKKYIARSKAWSSKNKERRAEINRISSWKSYGIQGMTVEHYDELFLEQKGVCAICHKPPSKRRLCVDHNHRTGQIRGLLCFRCNKYLVSNRTLTDLRAVVAYLEKYETAL